MHNQSKPVGSFQRISRLLMLRIPQSALLRRYGLAVIVVMVAVGLKLILNLVSSSSGASTPFLNLFPAIVVAAWYGGFGPGVFATLLGAIAADFFFLQPTSQLGGLSTEDAINLTIFVLDNLLISLLCHILRQAVTRAQSQVEELFQTDQALRQSEERFRLVQEATPDSFVIQTCLRNAQGQIVDFTWDYINPVTEKAMKTTIENLKGKSVLDIYPTIKTNGLFDTYVKVVETGRPVDMELHYVGEGIDRWFRNVIVKSGDGVAVTSLNITEIKLAEQARTQMLEGERETRRKAEEAQARLGFLAEASRVLNLSLDYKTTLQSVAEFAVPTMADWCTVHILDEKGYPQEIALAHKDPEKIAWARKLQAELADRYPYDPDAPTGLPNVLRTGQPELYPDITDEMLVAAAQDEEQLRLLREIGYSSVMIVPLVARGRVVGALQLVATESGQHFNAQDLELAQELAQREAIAVDNARLYQEAQVAIAARNEFLSIASHELKTPVTSLRGFAQLLIRQLDRQKALDPNRVRPMVETMEKQADKLARLITRLFDLSKLEAGRLVLEPETIDLVQLLGDLVTLVQTTTEKHQLVLHSPPVLEWLVDPLRFEQIIINLVDNAIKYSPNGGLIELSLSTPDRDTVCLMVKDQGLGISPEHRANIFEPFYQAHERGYAGLGMGLYISRQIIELHGGQITVEFPDEGGTCFIISLPRNHSYTLQPITNIDSEKGAQIKDEFRSASASSR